MSKTEKTSTPSAIKNRYDVMVIFDVKDGNPNGDPDQDNTARMDPETNQGLVSDACIKRKIRDYIAVAKATHNGDGTVVPNDGFDIFIANKAVLNTKIEEGKNNPDGIDPLKYLCDRYFDIRAFGGVLSTGSSDKDDSAKKTKAKGEKKETKRRLDNIRGPVQVTFARSVDPISPMDCTVFRCAVTNEKDIEKEKTFGHKSIVPYGLYVAKMFISPVDAARTGFSESDLETLFDAMKHMFETDRSAGRGDMSLREIIVFKHDTYLGNVRSCDLFDRVSITSKTEYPRSYSDYTISVNEENVSGVTITRL